jgi:transmembrane sensor
MKENSVSDSLLEAIVDYYDNTLMQAQAEELISWLDESDDNLKYFLDSGKLWYASGLLKKEKRDTEKGWLNLLDRIREYDQRPVPKKVVRIPVRNLYLAVAALALLIGLGTLSFLLFTKSGNKETESYYEALAPKGSRSVITLSDGSMVWLNSGTKLRYRTVFDKSSRELTLEGEAYFSVAENKSLPFRVKAGDIYITALGTAFNVKAYLEENVVETTLEKGEVVVEHLSGADKESVTSKVVLKPNQKAVFIKSSGDLSVNELKPERKTGAPVAELEHRINIIKVDTLVDTKLSTSWKDSKWIFKSEKLSTLAPILERRYDVTITFMDSVLINYKFTGTLKEESLEQVLKALTLAAPIRFEVTKNQVYLYEDKEQRSQYMKLKKQQTK